MPERPKNFSKSANRALDVLSYFATTQGPARAADIADALGMSRSSADQLLKTIVSGGYLLLSTPDKKYFPSPSLVKFGEWLSDSYPEDKNLRDLVAHVHEETDNIVHITVQNDCYMQMLEVAPGNDDDPTLKVGAKVPVIGSVIGAAALTTKSESEITRLVCRARGQRAFVDGFDGVRPLIERVVGYRRAGYSARANRKPCRGRSESYWSIAMVVPLLQRRPRFVLGLSGPDEQVRPKEAELVDLMRESIKRHLAN